MMYTCFSNIFINWNIYLLFVVLMDAIRGGVFLAIVMLIEDFTFGLRTLNSLKQMPSVPHSGPRLTIDVKDLRGTGMVATGG